MSMITDKERQEFFAFMTGYIDNYEVYKTPKTAAQKVKNLEEKNKKLVKEILALKAEIAALNRILGA